MKIAIIHDYLREYGGAERVVENLKSTFPEADVFVGFIDKKALGEAWNRFKDWDIKTTWLQKLPGIKKIYSPARIFAPKAFADLNLESYDIIISSSNAYFAKAVKKGRKKTTHFCYCHTPARSLYGYDTQSSQSKSWLIKVGGQYLNHGLRQTDFEVAQKVDVFIANSGVVSDRIAKFYRRKSEIVYPPIHLADQAKKVELPLIKKRDYYLYVNRLNYAKHPEIALKAALELNLKLKIVGTGPMLDELKRITQVSKNQKKIEFLETVSDEKLMEVYAGAKALLYPVADEDLGMVPIEAMAFGTPILAHRSGGPTETVIEGKTGLFFDELTTEGLIEIIKKFEWKVFDEDMIKKEAQKYTAANFEKQIKKLIKKYHGTG